MIPVTDDTALRALLEWYLAVGVDETIGELPSDRFRQPEPTPPSAARQAAPAVGQPRPAAPVSQTRAALPQGRSGPPPLPPVQPAAPIRPPEVIEAEARALAAAARDLPALLAAIQGFDGCALKATAPRTHVLDGTADAPVLVIGQAPEAEDGDDTLRGPAGRMLDRMLGSIGLDRSRSVAVTNMVFWRPPADRRPQPEEVSQCLPFVHRLIELLAPKALLLVGATAAETLLNRADGIARLRGHWADYRCELTGQIIPTLATYHPAYLLRSPLQKRDAWKDLMMLQERLESMTLLPKRHED